MNPRIDDVLSAESKEALRHLELRARKIVEGLLHGPHASRRLGVSVEFDHHRLYQPGDAIRHIDWRASAKHERVFIKRYREDTSLNVHLVMDFSASMLGETAGRTKAEHAVTVAACLAYLAVHQGDRVGLLALSEGDIVQRPLGASERHMVDLLQVLVARPARGGDDVLRHLDALLQQNLARGLVVFISDLMYDPLPVQRGLGKLHHQGHEVVAVNIRDPREENFPFSQWVNFIDLEETRKRVKVDAVLLRRLYAEEYRALMAEWQAWSRAQDVHFIASSSVEGAEDALVRYIAYRNRIGRR